MLDQSSGLAELTTTEPLDYEDKKEYKFQIEALSCSGTYTQR